MKRRPFCTGVIRRGLRLLFVRASERVRCRWCDAGDPGDPREKRSHGMCPRCQARFDADARTVSA